MIQPTYTDDEIDAFVNLGKSLVKNQLIINQVDKPENNKSLSLEEAMELGNRFARELQEEFKIDLIWYFVGSIRDKKYNSGTSDIDMVIIPKKEGMFGVDAIKRILAKMEEYKSFGTVFKKGRDISLIDVFICFDIKAVDFIRKNYKENNVGDENNGK